MRCFAWHFRRARGTRRFGAVAGDSFWEVLHQRVYGAVVAPSPAPLPRFAQFCERYRAAGDAGAGDAESIYNSREPAARGQRLKAAGDYPGLEGHSPTHDPASFAWAAEVEAATPALRAELSAFIALGEGAGRAVLEHDGGDDGDGAGWSADFFSGHYGDSFNGVALVRRGRPTAAAGAHFPRTMALLGRHGLGGANRLVFFARQRPNSGIPPHSDCKNYLYTAHLGIHVPAADADANADTDADADADAGTTTGQALEAEGSCGMCVAGRAVRWEEGKLSVFQNAYSHHTWNRTDRDRVVLYFDFWHPDLSAEEQRALATFTETQREFEEREDGVGSSSSSSSSSSSRSGRVSAQRFEMPQVDDPRLQELIRRSSR
jgi:hypothetical protein